MILLSIHSTRWTNSVQPVYCRIDLVLQKNCKNCAGPVRHAAILQCVGVDTHKPDSLQGCMADRRLVTHHPDHMKAADGLGEARPGLDLIETAAETIETQDSSETWSSVQMLKRIGDLMSVPCARNRTVATTVDMDLEPLCFVVIRKSQAHITQTEGLKHAHILEPLQCALHSHVNLVAKMFLQRVYMKVAHRNAHALKGSVT
jgi:hypothetical protein